MLFPDVVNCMQTEDLELKKLVYLYLINYAKTQPDLAIMGVNTFVKASCPAPRHDLQMNVCWAAACQQAQMACRWAVACYCVHGACDVANLLRSRPLTGHIVSSKAKHNCAATRRLKLLSRLPLKRCMSFCSQDTQDPNPLIRSLAVRTMGCIRVDKITEYLCDPLQRCLKVRLGCCCLALFCDGCERHPMSRRWQRPAVRTAASCHAALAAPQHNVLPVPAQDDDPYVRKTAAICVAKLFDINAELVHDRGFLDALVVRRFRFLRINIPQPALIECNHDRTGRRNSSERFRLHRCPCVLRRFGSAARAARATLLSLHVHAFAMHVLREVHALAHACAARSAR